MGRALTITAALAISGVWVIPAAYGQAPTGTPTEAPTGAPTRAPAGMPSEQATIQLEQAQAAAQTGDAAAATKGLQNAASELRTEAASAPEPEKGTLERSARDLDQAAIQASTAQGKPTPETSKKIAKVEHDLADLHLDRAKDSYARKIADATGHELKLATRHLENGAKWVGVKADRASRDVVGNAMRVSGTLVEGVGIVPKEVGKAIEGVGGEIDKLGKKVMPKK